MKKIEIYEFQAKAIQDALRIVSRVLNSSTKTTSLDRDIIQAKAYIDNALNGEIDTHVKRL